MTRTAYTISPPVANDQWHMNVPVRKNLMQATAPSIKIVTDEAKDYLDHFVGRPGTISTLNITGVADLNIDGNELSAWDLSFDLVCRTANRVLFGLDLAHDPRRRRVCVEYSEIMFAGADRIRH